MSRGIFTPHRVTNTSVDSVDKHSIKCIGCFDLCIDSVDKQDTLLNTQYVALLGSLYRQCRHKHSIKCIGCFDLCIDSVDINIACSNVHYCIGHVEMVDTKDQSNAIVY